MIVIIGSGVSSLAFAEKCRQDNREFVIFEKAEFGGNARTYKVGRYKFDIAGHFLHFPGDSPVIAGIKFDLPLRDRKAVVWMDGTVYPYPIQKAFEGKSINTDSVYRWDEFPEQSMTAFYEKQFGDLAWKFFVPYNTKLWACSTDELEQDYYEKLRTPVKGVGYNSQFMYAEEGAQVVPNTIGKHIKSLSLDRGWIKKGRVFDIDPIRKIVKIEDGNDIKTVNYDHVISPMPLPDTCKITRGYAEMPRDLRWSSVVVFNIGYRPTGKSYSYEGVSWMYVPSHEFSFFRVGWYSSASKSMAPKGCRSMYVEVSYPGERDGKICINGLRKTVLEDLIKIGILESFDQIDVVDHVIVEKAYPLSVDNKAKRVELITSALSLGGVHCVGRYGLWRWTGMFEDMKYAERLYDCMFRGGDVPSIYRC